MARPKKSDVEVTEPEVTAVPSEPAVEVPAAATESTTTETPAPAAVVEPKLDDKKEEITHVKKKKLIIT